MANHERTLLFKTLNFTFADLPKTNEAFKQYNSIKTIEFFSFVAKSIINELSEKPSSSFIIPKEITSSLLSILTTIEFKDLEFYIPCLNLLQVLLSSSIVPITQIFVNSLCAALSEIKNNQPSSLLTNFSFALLDSLYHLALSRRKKSESLDSA